MSKLLRNTLTILGAVIALLLVVVVGVLFLVDPEQYRSTIEDALFDATGLDLNIAGEMSLTYRPYIGVTLNDVRLKNPDRPQELASASLVSLRVNPAELLGGRLLVEELHADGFHFNWYVDGDGNNWWMTERLRTASDSPQEPSAGESAALETRFSFISISNASADIQNLQQGYFYSVRDLELSSQNSNAANQPFPLQATFELIEPTAPGPWPITLSSNNRIDLDAGDVEFTDIQLALTPALLQGSIQVKDVLGDASWQAQLSTNAFALDDLVDNLLARPEQTAAPQLPGFSVNQPWQTQLQLQISGDSSQIEMPQLVATLGDMRLEMAAGVRFASELLPTNVTFNIETNNLDLSPYIPAAPVAEAQLPVDDESFAPAPEPSSIFDLEIPESLWSDRNVQGTVSIESLLVSGIQLGSINLFAIVESGVLDMELQPASALNGSVNGNVRINSVPARSEVTLELVTDQVDVAELALPFLSPGAVTGQLNLASRFSGTGSTLGEWLDSFAGTSSFSITDNSVDVGVIKQMFTIIAALSPTGEAIQQWPDSIRFNEFNGYVVFENGLNDNQQINLQLDNFVILGSGGIDLNTDSFNYDLLFTVLGLPYLQTIPISEQYHGVAWPVRCAARFDDPTNQYCRPGLAQVREIFTQLANGTFQGGTLQDGTLQDGDSQNGTLQESLDEVETDRAAEPLPDAAGGVLRNLFQN